MKNSRLSLIFNTFSKKEIRDLRKWLISPAHNQRQDVRDLFEYLAKNIENDNQKALEKERIFKKLFPTEEYEDARFRQSIHFLTKAVEDFLTYRELLSDEVRVETSLASVYRKRGLDKLFNKTIKNANDLLHKSQFRNADFQQNEFLIQLENYAFKEKMKRAAEMNLQELTNALDINFIANKLKYSYLMLAHKTVFKADYDFGTLDSILEYVKKTKLIEIPSIGVYYHGLMANLEKEDPLHFQNLKNEIFEHTHLFPRTEARDIYLMAINYLIGKFNSGSPNALEQLFELYKNGMKNEVFIEDGKISRFTFLNIVNTGLRLAEYEYIDSFIEKNQLLLPESHRANMVDFSKTRLAFEKKDYKTAMQVINQTEFNDILMNLHAKNMLVKMLYEEDEFDTLESLLSSMRTYLTRKKVMGYHKNLIANFIKLTQKLLKVQPYDKTQIAKLRAQIEEAKPMASTERDWLLTQLERV